MSRTAAEVLTRKRRQEGSFSGNTNDENPLNHFTGRFSLPETRPTRGSRRVRADDIHLKHMQECADYLVS